jgi:NhaA family Na+:H+ antiporter
MIRSGRAQLPEGASWLQIYGVSVIAGIGFTMSLFIGLLAFDDPMLQNRVKLGVLAGSALSALFGAAVFALATKAGRSRHREEA